MAKSFHFNICIKLFKFLLLVVFVFLTVTCGQKDDKQNLSPQTVYNLSEKAININTASIQELEKLPHVGAKTAAKIVEHRQTFGRFKKPEHLLLIERMSDERFRELRNLIRTE